MLELKRHATEFKADLAKRQVTAYASTFGNVDGNDDIVVKGAYADTLTTDLPSKLIKVKRNHQLIIGKPIHAEEDSTGLLTVSQFSPVPLADETLALVQDEAITDLSIGFKTLERAMTTRDGRRVREVKRVKLFEWSFMDDIPANDRARVVNYKSLDDVLCVFDQMQSALWSLRNLARTPPEVLQRLLTLASDIEALTASADTDADAQQMASLSTLLTEMQSYLTPSARSA